MDNIIDFICRGSDSLLDPNVIIGLIVFTLLIDGVFSCVSGFLKGVAKL